MSWFISFVLCSFVRMRLAIINARRKLGPAHSTHTTDLSDAQPTLTVSRTSLGLVLPSFSFLLCPLSPIPLYRPSCAATPSQRQSGRNMFNLIIELEETLRGIGGLLMQPLLIEAGISRQTWLQVLFLTLHSYPLKLYQRISRASED